MRREQVIAAMVSMIAVAAVVIPALTLVDDERAPEQRPTVIRTDEMTSWRTPSPQPSSQPSRPER
ncbi:hypothetical protein SAMN04488564_112163 [Lentzea waywayandensis]|uniref:Uncharacterized protein n=1 Tax=Lentzea waywayandensis TaxID=84724 RepID=A0A1I6FDT5_9PSEU|nr:hypothetical protein [Lentzea waywayandensis]SFR28052.1 hypothetical protein SAMN04488564_112163 [Lentzea waywayandensis]